MEADEQAALGLSDPVLCRSSGLMSRLWRVTASLLSVSHVAINTPKDMGTDLFFDRISVCIHSLYQQLFYSVWYHTPHIHAVKSQCELAPGNSETSCLRLGVVTPLHCKASAWSIYPGSFSVSADCGPVERKHWKILYAYTLCKHIDSSHLQERAWW